ncbi:Stearoyl-CoA desaturase 5 [Halotydeus destructor]|nr:Stearoyl-CoA desaturase 5 [Halotydeus destructor]
MVFTKLTVNKDSYFYFINHGDLGIVWSNVGIFAMAHMMGLWAAVDTVTNWPFKTIIWTFCMCHIAGWGTGGAVHRMWAHRSFEAKLPLRIMSMLAQTVAGQNCIYIWSRDHRVHHKWSDTDADPHNTKRGFFFTHCGWLMRKKHPELMVKSKTLDFSDLLADPVVKFQKDYYYQLYIVFALILPVCIPVYAWSESWVTAFLLPFVMRYLITLHGTWFVNSAAHMWGDRPYNKDLAAVENRWVSVLTNGEGYHNYHHQFPSDYRASEDGHGWNGTKYFIEFMAAIGQAFNLRTASRLVVDATKERNLAQVVKKGKILSVS